MRVLDAVLSCAAMASAMLLGLAFGEYVDRFLPVRWNWFPLVGVASLFCLTIAALGPVESVHAKHQPITSPHLSGSLAALAVLLMMTDAFRHIDSSSAVIQLMISSPFLLGVGYFARRRAHLAAIGSAAFYATAVGMMYVNSRKMHGGQVGFWSISMH